MSYRGCAAAIAVLAVTALSAVPAGAQTLQTPWGAPDLQGIWDFRTITPLERPEELGDKAFLTVEEAAAAEQETIERNAELWEAEARRTEAGGNVGGYNNFWMDRGTRPIETRRTSLITYPPNGRFPELSAVGQERADARRAYLEEHPADSYTDRNTSDRCIVGFNAGPPITPLAYNQNMQLFQTPDLVVIYTEMVHSPRFVPLDGLAPLDPSIRLWSGDSRGRWEGNTLVIETANFSAQRGWIPLGSGGSGVTSTENMTLVERFTRVDEGTLEYTFTVTDPRDVGKRLDRVDADAAHRQPAVRVRLPRGQLLDAGHPGRPPGGRAEGGGGDAATAVAGAAMHIGPARARPRRPFFRPVSSRLVRRQSMNACTTAFSKSRWTS